MRTAAEARADGHPPTLEEEVAEFRERKQKELLAMERMAAAEYGRDAASHPPTIALPRLVLMTEDAAPVRPVAHACRACGRWINWGLALCVGCAPSRGIPG